MRRPASPTAPELLFVYGTLRADARHPAHRLLAAHAARVGPATVAGVLHDLGAYPGLVPGDAAGARVVGELWALRPELAAATLARLDAYEGCAPDDPLPHQYRRVRLPVRLDDGRSAVAWSYALAVLPRRPVLVPGGDWVAAQAARRAALGG